MGREIKFRAWDTQLKKYTYSGFGGKTFSIFIKRVNCNRYIVEQYTGLKDCDGKDIYECDSAGFNLAWVFESIAAGYKIKIIGNIHERNY